MLMDAVHGPTALSLPRKESPPHSPANSSPQTPHYHCLSFSGASRDRASDAHLFAWAKTQTPVRLRLELIRGFAGRQRGKLQLRDF